jgi:hypothetical protein
LLIESEGFLRGGLCDEKDQILDIYGCEYACVEFAARPRDYADICPDDGSNARDEADGNAG